MNLRELKKEIRTEISNGKRLLKTLRGSKSITGSGYVVTSSDYDRKLEIEHHVAVLESFLERLSQVKSL